MIKLVIGGVLFIGLAVGALSTKLSSIRQQQELVSNQAPSATYNAPEPKDSKKYAKWLKKSERYNKTGLVSSKYFGPSATHFNDWEVRVPVLPVKQSDAIVIGQVTGAQSYLSSDKTGLYTEFTLVVSDVLLNSVRSPIFARDEITLERQGGRVQYPEGISELIIAGQEMPRIGKRYLFFLKAVEPDFLILTGYELTDGRIQPLDGLAGFKKFSGKAEAAFTQEVRQAIAAMPQAIGGEP